MKSMSNEKLLAPLDDKEEEKFQNFIQIIHSDETFIENYGDFLNHFQDLKDLEYFIVSTFGPQSSGKSTLLNHLFGTDFPTMNMSGGRYRCTQGIYCSVPKDFQKMIVFDLEGTDSGERGEEKAFERRISLFALAVSDILIINNWLSDIGRYVGSNISLLKVCFELNLKLFQKMKKNRKTLLMFTIRDFPEETNFQILKKQIMKRIEEVWDELIKPQEYKNSPITDFFDFMFLTLPHLLYREEEFMKKVKNMREYFNMTSKDFVYKKSGYSHHIPKNDLPKYLEGIWDVIKTDKDLDIPTQRRMVAMFRCDEIGNELMKKLDENLKFWGDEIESRRRVKSLGETGKLFILKLMDEFLGETELYLPDIVEDKSAKLKDKFKMKFKETCCVRQIEMIKRNAMEFLKKNLNARMGRDDRMKLFQKEISKLKETVMGFFEKNAKTCLIYENEEEEKNEKKREKDDNENKEFLEAEETKLLEEIFDLVEVVRKQQLGLMMDDHKGRFKSVLAKKINKLLQRPKNAFWKRVREEIWSLFNYKDGKGVRKTVSKQEKDFIEELKVSFECSEVELRSLVNEMKKFIFNTTLEKINDYLKHLPSKMVENFDKSFPTVLTRGTDVYKKFKFARLKGLQLMDIFFIYKLELVRDYISVKDRSQKFEYLDKLKLEFPDPDDGSISSSVSDDIEYPETGDLDDKSRILLDEDKCTRLYKDYVHDIKIKYIRAKIELERNQTSIPWWLYIVILLLGWNELWYVLKNPLLMIVIVALFAVFGWSWFKNYIENGLIYGDFPPLVNMAIRTVVSQLPPQILGKNFGKKKDDEDEDDEEEGEKYVETKNIKVTPLKETVVNKVEEENTLRKRNVSKDKN